jgi:hypothetical protein
MTTKPLLLAFALLVPAAGCDKGKDSAGPVAASATAAAAGPSCPAGSSLSSGTCVARGTTRVATISWGGLYAASGPIFTVKNTAGVGLKRGTVSLWFYDKSGRRLDASGAKKWSSSTDIFSGATLAAGSQRDTTFNFPRANVPDGAAQIEGEIVAATVAAADGSDGPAWKNDDLNVDDRAMANPPPAAAAAAAPGGGAPAGAAPGTPPAGTAPPATTAAAGNKPAATVPGGTAAAGARKAGTPTAPGRPH